MKHYYRVKWKNYDGGRWNFSKTHFKNYEEAQKFLKTKEYVESKTILVLGCD